MMENIERVVEFQLEAYLEQLVVEDTQGAFRGVGQLADCPTGAHQVELEELGFAGCDWVEVPGGGGLETGE